MKQYDMFDLITINHSFFQHFLNEPCSARIVKGSVLEIQSENYNGIE